jgi:hypothetical protein
VTEQWFNTSHWKYSYLEFLFSTQGQYGLQTWKRVNEMTKILVRGIPKKIMMHQALMTIGPMQGE